MRKAILAAALASLGLASPATAMDVATYLAKVELLRQRGSMTAMLSSEYAELRAEITASGAALRQERLAAVAAGRPPAYCPPAGANLTTEEIYAATSAVPPARRHTIQVSSALRAAFARKYPCPS
jgi:hypothetical protein